MIKVIGVGDNFVDKYIDDNMQYPGGNSVNFAVYAKMLGHESAYCGVVANDEQAKLICDTLKEFDVDYSKCVYVKDGETGTGTISHISGDRVIKGENEGGSVKTTPLKLTPELLEYIKGFDVAHSVAYAYMDEELCKIKQTGVPLVYDFSDSWNEERLELICKSAQIVFLSGAGRSKDEMEQVLKQAINCGSEIAIATQGKNGAIIFDGKKMYTKKPYGQNDKIVDSMGAGDSFLTGFATTYYNGLKMLENLQKDSGNHKLNSEDYADYYANLIEYSMSVANAIAIRSCMVKGAFGHGIAYNK